jgi:hypothetical protein
MRLFLYHIVPGFRRDDKRGLCGYHCLSSETIDFTVDARKKDPFARDVWGGKDAAQFTFHFEELFVGCDDGIDIIQVGIIGFKIFRTVFHVAIRFKTPSSGSRTLSALPHPLKTATPVSRFVDRVNRQTRRLRSAIHHGGGLKSRPGSEFPPDFRFRQLILCGP